MGFFSRLVGRSSSPPEWAAFFEPDEYAVFEGKLREALAARSLPNGAGDVRSGAIPFKIGKEDGSLGFGPIARKCRGLKLEQWAALIAEHLDRALEPNEALVARLAADFQAAREYLKVQLVPDGFVRPDWEENLNFRTFGPGVKAALVYDLPTSVHSVPAADVRRWARASSELFEIAADNVRAEPEKPTIEHVDIADAGVAFEQLLGDSFFVCSHALWLDQYHQASSERGVLVAIPSRHTVLFHPIRDASAWRAMSTLPFMAADLHSKLPGPVSSSIFWVEGGRVTEIPVRRVGAELQVMPSESVTNAMAGLQEA